MDETPVNFDMPRTKWFAVQLGSRESHQNIWSHCKRNYLPENQAFADNIALVGRSRKFVAEAFNLLETEAGKLGLKINADKTKFTETLSDSQPFKVKNYAFETISQFKYHGTTVTANNDLTVELNNRLAMSNKRYHGLKNQLKSRFMSLKIKINIYKTLTRPILLYRSDCW